MLVKLVLRSLQKRLKHKAKSASYLEGKVVLITGSSKGLGHVLAEHLIKENCRLAICSRHQHELEEAQQHLEKLGAREVFLQQCDVGDRAQVEDLMRAVLDHYGGLDVLINNAGIIQVGPVESFVHADFQKAMDVIFWGCLNTTLAILPHFQARQQGHIVNITSIGGKVSVPHLMPYNAAKAAAISFSEGMAGELLKDGIHVTTIVPWLMRTGSYINALFQEGNKREFQLFSFMSSAPLLTISADKAARRIIKAIKLRRALKVVGPQARMAMEFHHFFPELTVKLSGIITRLLPRTQGQKTFEPGKSISEKYPDSELPGVRLIGQRVQEKHQQIRP
jgi:short-subunit dehydrogenase